MGTGGGGPGPEVELITPLGSGGSLTFPTGLNKGEETGSFDPSNDPSLHLTTYRCFENGADFG